MANPVFTKSSEFEEQYDNICKQIPNVGRKGKTLPYTSVNGNMYSFLDRNGEMSVRLPEKDRISFLETFDSKLSEQHGTNMKEYVVVPKALFKDTSKMVALLARSLKYASSLRPKGKRLP